MHDPRLWTAFLLLSCSGVWAEESMSGSSFCGTILPDKPPVAKPRSPGKQYPTHYGSLTVPILLMYDDALHSKMGPSLRRFLLSLMKAVQVAYDSPPLQQHANLTFQVVGLQETAITSDGNTYQMLRDLASWRSSTRGPWKLVMLLTGLNLYTADG